MTEQQLQNEFKIGHSLAQSQTFIPHFFSDGTSSSLMFTDIAGLNDSDGELIDLVNCFVNKKIFNIASKVKFLIPFSYNQIMDSRGKSIMDHVETVMALCENS